MAYVHGDMKNFNKYTFVLVLGLEIKLDKINFLFYRKETLR